MKVKSWTGAFVLVLCAACSGDDETPSPAGKGGAAGGDAGVDARALHESGAADGDARGAIECQPGSQQACRGHNSCWGHRNCSDQYTYGDCICDTGAGGGGAGGVEAGAD
jgi:hypothetical protein